MEAVRWGVRPPKFRRILSTTNLDNSWHRPLYLHREVVDFIIDFVVDFAGDFVGVAEGWVFSGYSDNPENSC